MSDVNPYQSPESAPALIADDFRPKWSTGAKVTAMLVVVAAVCYAAFVIVLLQSSSNDFEAGLIWSINLPTFALWLYFMFARRWKPDVFGHVAAGIQVLITALMLAFGIGDTAIVLAVNGGVIVGFIALAFACQFTLKKHEGP